MQPHRGSMADNGKIDIFRRVLVAVMLAVLPAGLATLPAAANPPDASLIKGAEFVKVRRDLIKAGWKPAPTEYAKQNGASEDEYGEAKRLYQAGYVEVEICSEGSVHCIFNYRRDNACLRLTTQGEFAKHKGRQYPLLVKWTSECSP